MRLSRTPHGRITLIYVALVIVIVVAVSGYLLGSVKNPRITDLEEQLERQVVLVRDLTARFFDGLIDQSRIQAASVLSAEFSESGITVFGVDGAVLADVGNPPGGPVASLSAETLSALKSDVIVRTRTGLIGGEEYMFVDAPIVLNGETVGFVRASRSTSASNPPVGVNVLIIIFTAALILILSVVLAYLLARRDLRSTEAIVEGARRFAQGDLDYRMDTAQSEDTRQLAETLNQMAAAMSGRVRDLSVESNHMSVVMDTMADGIIVINGKGQVELMNFAAEWMLESPNHEAAGKPLAEVVQDHEILQLVEEATTTRQTRQAELELVHRRRFLNVIATPLSEGSNEGVLLTLQDATRLWQVETTRREFVSNVSHELRSPLAAIRSMTEILQDGTVDNPDVAQDFLARIQSDVQRMTTMVNELLELSRLESGQVPIHLAPVHLASVVKEVESRFSVGSEDKHLTLDTIVPDDTPLIIGEADKLIQVLGNLVENAVKFTCDGGSICISADTTERWVEVKVKDTGIGIPHEHLPHVFERFYKVDRSRRDGGTGLGLAIVKHLVQAHGGDIKADSVEGEGSTFSFTLPRAS